MAHHWGSRTVDEAVKTQPHQTWPGWCLGHPGIWSPQHQWAKTVFLCKCSSPPGQTRNTVDPIFSLYFLQIYRAESESNVKQLWVYLKISPSCYWGMLQLCLVSQVFVLDSNKDLPILLLSLAFTDVRLCRGNKRHNKYGGSWMLFRI